MTLPDQAADRPENLPYRVLFDDHPMAMYVYDLDTLEMLEVNAAGLRAYGYSREEFLSLTLKDNRPAEDWPALQEVVSKVGQGQRKAGIWRHKRKDGSIFLADINGHTISFKGRRAELIVVEDVTERVEHERELEEKRRLARVAGRIARLGGWSLDLETSQVQISDQGCEILGLSLGSTIQFDELVSSCLPDMQPNLRAQIQNCGELGRSLDLEVQMHRPDGSLVWIRMIGEPVAADDLSIQRVEGAVQDINEEKRLRKWQDDQFRKIADLIPEIIWTAKPSGEVDFVNRALFDYTHPNMAASLPHEWLEICHPEDRERVFAVWQDTLDRGQSYSVDFRIQSKDGQYRWHTVRANPILAPGGSISKWYGTAVDIHESRLVQSELKQAQRQFKLLVDNIGEVFWISSADKQNMLYVSPGYSKIWQRSPKELLENPRQWFEAIHPGDRDRVASNVGQQVSGGYAEEYRIVLPNGQIRWISDRAEPVQEPDGEVNIIVGVASDITQRKEFEFALEDSQAKFKAIAAATSDIIWDRDFAQNTIWWSDQLEHRLGYDRRTFADPHAWEQALHPDDRERVIGSVRVVLEGNHEFWHERYRFFQSNGQIVHVEDRGAILRDENGNAVRFVGGMADVSERVRFETELGERIKELRCLYRVLEITSDESLSVDVVCGAIVELLPEALQYPEAAVVRIGLDSNEFCSTNWDDAQQVIAHPVNIQGRNIGEISVGYRTSPEAGVFLEEERQLLASIAAHLASMIERNRLQSVIAQSERMTALGELTGGIAHDFNNLLTVIMGQAEFLADDLHEDDSGQQIVQTILEAAGRGGELIERLLAFARRQPLEPRRTAVTDLLARMQTLMERTLGEQINIRLIAHPEIWPALVDEGQLENAILNLAINARDAMEQGGSLTIELSNSSLDEDYAHENPDVEPGDYLSIAVSDTGHGIDPETLKRVFDPFFTTKPYGKGSGLGLSMVFGFIKQSNGHIKIYSEVGHGTTVRLYLPRADDVERVQNELPRERSPQTLSALILVVEDDDALRRSVERQLRTLGYGVLLAPNAEEALELIAARPDIDLLFTDIVMPGRMNGHQLAREAQRLNPELSVLYTSGYTENTIVHQGRLDEGIQLLSKPYRRIDLAEKLRAVLAIRKK